MKRAFRLFGLLAALCTAASFSLAASACNGGASSGGGASEESGLFDSQSPGGGSGDWQESGPPSDTSDGSDGSSSDVGSDLPSDTSEGSDGASSDIGSDGASSENGGESPSEGGRILLLEHREESEALAALLNGSETDFDVTVMNVADDGLPRTAEALCEYDGVILNNVANADMPAGFDEILYSFVHEYGGGLLTAGGRDETGEAHAYRREDMAGTRYEEMLPVEIVDYKPPLAVMVLLDGSGSMQSVQGADGTTKFEGAKQGIVSALGAFSGRDYVGLMTLSETYDTVLPLTSAAQSEMIGKAVADAAPSGAATLFSGALAAAGQALAAETRVSKRHIVLITDGRPAEGDYLAEAERLYRDYGITLSVFGIGTSGSEEASLQELAEVGGGRFYAVADAAALGGEMVNELRSPELTEVEYTPFYPVACDLLSPLFDGVALGAEGNGQAMPFTLDYFYGTSLKDSSEAVLVGDYDVPVYAQWTFGKGRVGSFLCDLGDFWPTGFTADENGEKFLLNAVGYLTGAEKAA